MSRFQKDSACAYTRKRIPLVSNKQVLASNRDPLDAVSNQHDAPILDMLCTTHIKNIKTMENEIRPLSKRLSTLRVIKPGPSGIFSYYDGRVGGRLISHEPNTIDDGAFVLGVSTYAIVSGSEAVLFDAGITLEHAMFMLDHVKSLGVTKVTLVYSHFHSDHIAGAAALKEVATVIAHVQTLAQLEERKNALEEGVPPVEVVLPTRTYEKSLILQVGTRTVELHHFNIHTSDGTVIFLPEEGLLFAGDTLEDTATYIDDAANLTTHQHELKRMAELPITKILPAHGCPSRIAAGGYEPTFIHATLRYIQAMDEDVQDPAAWNRALKDVLAADLEAGNLVFFEKYEDVHLSNVKSLRSARQNRPLA
jgi:cyclase